MKIAKEYKIGFTILLVLFVVVWGLNFLKSKNVFKKNQYYYAIFDDVQGLNVSNPVFYNGYKIGTVEKIAFTEDYTGNLIVSLSIRKDFNLKISPKAIIYTVDLMGTKAIKLVPCKIPVKCQPGDTLQTEVKDIIADMESYAVPIQKQVTEILSNLNKTLIYLSDSSFQSNLSISIKQLKETSIKLNKQLPETIEKTKNTFDKLDGFIVNLNNNQQKINDIFQNIKEISDTLKLTKLNKTFEEINLTFEKTNALLTKIENEGRPEDLIKKDSLYLKLIDVSRSLDSLIIDIHNNPKKYVKFSVF